jgi:hypothetical protein
MTAQEALARMTHALAMASDIQFEQIETILRQGAGDLGLPDGARLLEPAGLVDERREVWVTLQDSLRIDTVGVDEDWNPRAEWEPVYAGNWESVLVSLVIEQDWVRIHKTADELAKESERVPR